MNPVTAVRPRVVPLIIFAFFIWNKQGENLIASHISLFSLLRVGSFYGMHGESFSNQLLKIDIGVVGPLTVHLLSERHLLGLIHL